MREVYRNPALRRLELAWVGSIIGSWAYAIALDLLQKARAARAVLESEGGEAEAVARFVSLLADAEPERKEAALRLLRALEQLLQER